MPPFGRSWEPQQRLKQQSCCPSYRTRTLSVRIVPAMSTACILSCLTALRRLPTAQASLSEMQPWQLLLSTVCTLPMTQPHSMLLMLRSVLIIYRVPALPYSRSLSRQIRCCQLWPCDQSNSFSDLKKGIDPNPIKADPSEAKHHENQHMREVAASCVQVAAMWTIDRERSVFDELVNLLDAKSPLPAVAQATYLAIVSKHMDLLGFRQALLSSVSLLDSHKHCKEIKASVSQ